MSLLKYGDIVSVGLSQRSATEPTGQSGFAVIISADIINENLQTVIVCPLIAAKNVSESRIGATFIPGEAIGLDSDSVVLSLQIKTISKDKIIKRVSSLPSSYVCKIKESLQAVLDIEE